MGVMKVDRLLMSMAWPAILSMTINALYNIVDSIFVAMVSEKALTAVSFVMPIQMLMIAFAIGTAVGINSLISRRLGANRQEEADQAASTAIRIGIFNYIIFALIGIFLTEPFMRIFTNDPETLSAGMTYMRIVTIGCLFSMVEINLEKVLQATGNMIFPMVISLCGAITNLILDPILIFGLLGAPRLGIAGAAMATISGQFVSLLVATFVIKRREHLVNIKLWYKQDWQVVKDIYAVGFPSIIMQSITSVMILGYNKILAPVPIAVAVLGIYFKLQSFVFMPVFGLSQGTLPIAGYNFGAKKKERLLDVYRLALKTAIIIMALGVIVFQVLPKQLLGFFSATPDMIDIGVPALRIISLCFIPAAIGIINSTIFQATGYGIYSLLASLIRQLVGILPIAYVLYNSLGVNASWASFPLAEILGLVYSVAMFKKLKRKQIDTM